MPFLQMINRRKHITLIVLLLIAGRHTFAQQDSVTANTESIENTWYDEEPENTYVEEDDEYARTTESFFTKNPHSKFDSTAVSTQKTSDGYTSALKKQRDFWYVNYQQEATKKTVNEGYNFTINPVVRTIIWGILILLLAAAIIWFVYNSKLNLWGRTDKRIQAEAGFMDEKSMLEADFNTLITNAEKNSNYNLSIRYLFLKALRGLAQSGVIEYRQDATNYSYLMQLYGKPVYNEFAKASRDYEFAWYGKVTVNAAQYAAVKSTFKSLYKNAGIQ